MRFRSNGPASSSTYAGASSTNFGLPSLLLMIAVGIVAILVGLYIISSSKIDPSWTRVEGSVVDYQRKDVRRSRTNGDASRDYDDETYYPIVQYEVNGQNYTVKSSLGSSTQPMLREKRTVAYESGSPKNAKLEDSAGTQMLYYLIPVVGAAVIIASVVWYIGAKKRQGVVKGLKQTGYKTTGVIVDIMSQNHGAGTNASGYKITVSAVNQAGSTSNYISDEVYSIGGLAMVDLAANPVPIDVYIDTANPENYYVDIEDIPNLTPQRIADMLKSVTKTPEFTSINSATQLVSQSPPDIADGAAGQQPQQVQQAATLQPQPIVQNVPTFHAQAQTPADSATVVQPQHQDIETPPMP